MNRDFKGIWIPAEVWLDNSLTPLEKLILMEIHSLEKENGCFASNGHFSKINGSNSKAAGHIITALKHKGVIRITYNDEISHSGRRIFVTHPALIKNTEGGIGTIDGGIGTIEGGLETIEHKYTIKETTKENISLFEKKREEKTGKQPYPEDFEQFWQSFPSSNKGNKPNAFKAWKKLCKSDRIEASNRLMYFFKFNQKSNENYYIHASTFLNQNRWQDVAKVDTFARYVRPANEI